jgi:hypothetical protein
MDNLLDKAKEGIVAAVWVGAFNRAAQGLEWTAA